MTINTITSFVSQPTKEKTIDLLNLHVPLSKDRLIINDCKAFAMLYLTTYKSNMAVIRNN